MQIKSVTKKSIFCADGLMQCFQMVTFPDINQQYEICEETMPPALESWLQQLFVEMDKEALNNIDRVLHFDET